MSRFLNGHLAKISAYVPGEQPQDKQYIKLNTNESPYPPSESVIKAISRKEIENLRLYSDPECKVLREKLAECYCVDKENVFVSNGSDEILNFAFMAYGGNGAAFPDITYGFYNVFAGLYGIKAEIIPLKADFTIDAADYYSKNKLIVIANPNAPTGIALSTCEIEKILSSNKDGIVLVDEAYVDFGAESCVGLVKKYDNLLVAQTFSKSRSMAGARLGFAFGNEALIKDLEKIKYSTNPYNINSLTQRAGTAALCENKYYSDNCSKIAATRQNVTESLRAMGFCVLDSKTNFVFAKSDAISGKDLYLKLKKRGILIRHFKTERISDYNRITVGTAEEMKTFIMTVREIIGGKI